MLEVAAELPPLDPADRALLLELTDPARPRTDHANSGHPDALSHAHFLARSDIQPHLAAIQAFRTFRAEIERNYRADKAIDTLLEIARTTDNLVEKRLAATAVIRLLYPPRSGARRASEGHRARGASQGSAGLSHNSVSATAPTSAPSPRQAGSTPAGKRASSSISPSSSSSSSSSSSPVAAESPAHDAFQPGRNPHIVRGAPPRPSPPSVLSVPSVLCDLWPPFARPDRPPRRSRTQSLALAAGAAPFDSS